MRGRDARRGRTCVCWGWLLLVGLVLACAAPESDRSDAGSAPVDVAEGGAAPAPSPPGPEPGPERQVEVLVPQAVAAPEVSPLVPEEPEAPAPPALPLVDLLRLPSTSADQRAAEKAAAREREAEVRAAERLKPAAPPEEAAAKQERTDRPLEVEFGMRKDAPVHDPSKARTRTDAGVAVGVDETTRIRGGVRVEQDEGKEREEPVPTVGIEKRF